MTAISDYLKRLESKTEYILREIKQKFNNPCMLWSVGKDSTLMLYLTKQTFYDTIPWPIVHIDTGYKFQEMYSFRDQLVKEWDIQLNVVKSNQAGKLNCNEIGHFECCNELKTNTLRKYIETTKCDAVIVGIRRDEHGIRNKERYMSPRDNEFKWNTSKERENKENSDSGLVAMQDSEMQGWDIYATEFEGAAHVRCHPILHWSEKDVWTYSMLKNIPVNPLYFSKQGKRYRSLGCQCCTNPIESDADTIKKIVDELEITNMGERSGRAQDKEDEYMMEKLRTMGYM